MEELGRGLEGVVYKVGNQARKTFFSSKPFDDNAYIVASRLSLLSLSTITRPLKLHYNEAGDLIGYDMKLLPKDKGKVSEMEIDKLLVNIHNIRKDLDTLTFHNILVKDLHRHNIAVNGDNIYVFDFGFYRYEPDSEHVGEYNNKQLDLLIGYDSLVVEEYDMDPRDVSYLLYHPFLASREKYIEEYIDKEINGKYKTLKQYIRRQ